jgi:Zn-dependent protease
MILSVIFAIYMKASPVYQNSTLQLVSELFLYAIYINWGLFIFNLIPLPPLDGSHLLFNTFRKYPDFYDALYKYGSYVFIGLILATILTKINFLPIWPAIRFLAEGFLSVIGYK